MAYDFNLPSFLTDGTDADTIHEKMMSMLPDDIDKTEGGFPWDFTRPTAVIAAELLQYFIPESIKLMFAQWSTGSYLDLLATPAQITRKEANCATAVLRIEGTPGTEIPAGTVFATEATGGVSSIEFISLDDTEIGTDGYAMITVQAVDSGTGSNVNPGSIVLMSVPISGVTSVTNPEKASGGTAEESDDDLRERILEAYKNMDTSYVGNNSDYKRWAEEVAGIGTAIVIPEWNGPETVKIVCLDANGEAANQTLLTTVYNHIMQPDSPMDRLAPPNVILTVAKPTLVNIVYAFKAELESGFETGTAISAFEKSLEAYYKTVSSEGVVKYNHVHSLLESTPGIKDFTGLTMNGGTSNISIAADEYPYTESVSIGIGGDD